jgi:hypothetical protein
MSRWPYLQILPHERPMQSRPLPPRVDYWMAMLEAIQSAPQTAPPLAKQFGLPVAQVRRQLHLLHQAKIIHIESWTSAGHTWDARYAKGTGIDAPIPVDLKTRAACRRVTRLGNIGPARKTLQQPPNQGARP